MSSNRINLQPNDKEVEALPVDFYQYGATSVGPFQTRPFSKDGKPCIEAFLVFISIVIVVLFFPFSLFIVHVTVRQFERAVILRNGKLRNRKCYGPGLICYLPCVDSIKFIDLRIISLDINPQEALTKDSLSVTVDGIIYYKVKDPIAAVLNVFDYKVSTKYIVTSALRNALGARKLSEILSNRSAVSTQIFDHMVQLTADWGVKIIRFEIKDITLPSQLQKAMAAEAEAARLTNAKIIVAKAEIECTKNLLKATEFLLENPWGMSLRYLQSIQLICGENTHTVIAPFSVDALFKLMKSSAK